MDRSIEEVAKMVDVSETELSPVPDIGRDRDHALNSVSTERRNSGARRKSTVGGWTDEEDAKLEEAVQQYNSKNWKMIATKLPGRTDVQCLHRWQKVLDPNLIKGPWTKEEDDLIVALVVQHGEKHWSLVAKNLPGRIGKQCRERWNNYLKPGIIRTPWTEQEDSILVEAHRQFGNKWAELTKLLPGRSENAIKNHWNCTLSKRVNSPNNGKRRPASEPSSSGGSDLKNSVEGAREFDYHSSFRTMHQNVGIVIREPTTESATRDRQQERAEVATPAEESTSRMCLDLFESPSPSTEQSKLAGFDSSSGLSLDFVSGTITERSSSLSTPLHDTRLSQGVSCPESLLRSVADSYRNFPSIIRKRDSQAIDTEKDDSSGLESKRVSLSPSLVSDKRVATTSIMLFGKCIQCEFNVTADEI